MLCGPCEQQLDDQSGNIDDQKVNQHSQEVKITNQDDQNRKLNKKNCIPIMKILKITKSFSLYVLLHKC